MADDEDEFLDKVRSFMGRPMYYGRKGEPLNLRQWAEASEDLEYKRVAYDELPATTVCPASYLSTVWLGLDHNFLLTGPPIIFETMRFQLESVPADWRRGSYHPSLEFPDPEDSAIRTEQMRYCTEEQASLGHRLIVRLIQEKEMQ